MRERSLGAACEGFYGRGGDRAKRGSGGVEGHVRAISAKGFTGRGSPPPHNP
jgi:hypothetical protein